MPGFSSFCRDTHTGSGTQSHAPGPEQTFGFAGIIHALGLISLVLLSGTRQDCRILELEGSGGVLSVLVSSGQGLGYRNYSGLPEAGSVCCGGQSGWQMPGRDSPLH